MTKPLSLNHFQHHLAKAQKVKAVRTAAKELALSTGIPACRKIRTTLIYVPRDRRRRDSLNLVPTLKAVEDGLVDAGIVPDDTGDFVESQMPLIDIPDPGAKSGRLTVLVERVL